MPIYNLIEYSNNYSKTSGRLWQYYRDQSAFNDAGAIDDFPGNSASMKFKKNIILKTENNGTKYVDIVMPV